MGSNSQNLSTSLAEKANSIGDRLNELASKLESSKLEGLASEASALAKVPLAGTNYTVGVDNYHKI